MKLIHKLRNLIANEKRLEKTQIEDALFTFENNKARAATPELIMKDFYPKEEYEKCKSHSYNFGDNLLWKPHMRGTRNDSGDLYICKECGCDVFFERS